MFTLTRTARGGAAPVLRATQLAPVVARPAATAAAASTEAAPAKAARVPRRVVSANAAAENASRREETVKKAASLKLEPFHYKAGVVVERPQVLVPEPEPWLKSYVEWRHKWDMPLLKQYPHINVLDEDIDQAKQREADEKKAAAAREKLLATETPEEREQRVRKEEREKRMAELKKKDQEGAKVVQGSRITEADRKNDRRSLYRRLDAKLFLIVQSKKVEKGESAWRFPTGLRAGEETFRKTAERELPKEVGAKLETHFVGNGPVTFFYSEYSEAQQKATKCLGSKTFFQYAYFLNGEVKLSGDLSDYAWVTKDELKEYLSPQLLAAILPALPEDGKDAMVPRQHYIPLEKPTAEY